MTKIFEYDDRAMDYLSNVDCKIAESISKFGFIEREVETDLFKAFVKCILSQQISTKAYLTVWDRFQNKFSDSFNPTTILDCPSTDIIELGLSSKKVEYIKGIAQSIKSNELDYNKLCTLSDNNLRKELTKLNGVGVWTADMIMIFCMERKDILSYNDFGIRKGLSIIHNLEILTKKSFKTFQKLYSPYGTIASFYLWKVANNC